MNEKEYLESCQLQKQLREMQYDETLTEHQRKMANIFYKELTTVYPQFPSIHPSVVRDMIARVK